MRKLGLPITAVILTAILLSACGVYSTVANLAKQQLSAGITVVSPTQQFVDPTATALATPPPVVSTSAPGASGAAQNLTTPVVEGTSPTPAAAQSTSTPTLAPTVASQQTLPATGPVVAPNSLLQAYENTLQNIYTQVNPSVVNIQVVEGASSSSSQTNPFGLPNNNVPSQALGSGFVWDTSGHIVTNNHVVDGSTSIEVTFSDGTTYPANVVGTDPYSDLAVVKVDAPADLLKPVSLGDSTQVKVGQMAIAIGNPFGLSGTMTVGIVSALNRSLQASQGASVNGQFYSIPDIIQTDAPINPGNSGGVLVDAQGQVIGVTAAIESSTQSNSGIGFVIPSRIVANVVPELIQTGTYKHSWLGISGTNLDPSIAKEMGLNAQQRGALVVTVVSGGPAAQAGLKASNQQATINGIPQQIGGDVIISIDGHSINSMNDLISYLAANTQVGQKITLTILRNGKQENVDVTLGERPASSSSTQSGITPNNQAAWLGVSTTSVTSGIAQAMQLPADTTGLLVEQVVSGSPAEQAGLQAGTTSKTINGQQVVIGGDIILAIDGNQVATPQQLSSFIQNDQPGQIVILTILRNGNSMDIQVQLAARPSQTP